MKKKLAAALLAVCMVASMLMPAAAATTFNDVDENAWYAESIERWTEYGILNGKGDGVFAPEKEMTRAEFAKVIVTLLGLPVDEDAECPFEDVKGTNDEWAIPYIAAAYKAGIIKGTNTAGTKFAPGRSVSFNDSAAMLSRALGLVAPGAYGEKVTEKLTELGLLDKNVNAEMDFNRAGVAALADNMIGVYVTMDNIDEVTEGGVITDKVDGVVLVTSGVRVELKDATVSAVVVQGGEVALTGETTVDTVKVGGESASVKAEEGTTVGSVTVGGENAKVELKGEVTEVVVAEDAAGEPEIVVPEGVEVANNSTVDVTVNGETVEGKPVEENPDEDKKDDTNEDYENWDGGFVSSPDVPAVKAPPASEGTVNGTIADADKVQDKNEDGTPKVDEGGNPVYVDACTEGHTWETKLNTTDEATCAAVGSGNYKCSVCGIRTVVELPKIAHTAKVIAAKAATCTEDGWKAHYECSKDTCSNVWVSGTGIALTEEEKAALTIEKLSDADPAAHTWGQDADKKATGVCTVCGEVCDHNSATTGTCAICGKVLTETVTPEHTHTWSTTAWAHNESHHWHTCTSTTGTCNVNAQTGPVAADQGAAGYAQHTQDASKGTSGWQKNSQTSKFEKVCACGAGFAGQDACPLISTANDATDGTCTLCQQTHKLAPAT